MKELLAWILLPLLGVNLAFYVLQPAMVFFPARGDLPETPADWGLDYADVHMQTEDGIGLHGWYIPSPKARYTLLFLHGNAGNIAHRQVSVRIMHDLGLNILIFDYRGYGLSEGSPSEQGLYRDATAAWRYLTQRRGVEPTKIIVFGRSLGGAVAAKLAAEVEIGGVIIESSFSSGRDMARQMLPGLAYLIYLRYPFEAARNLAKAQAPLMLLHSPDDEVIPMELARRLYAAAPQPKTFVELRGGHNDGFMHSRPAYDEALAAFVSRLDTAAATEGATSPLDRP